MPVASQLRSRRRPGGIAAVRRRSLLPRMPSPIGGVGAPRRRRLPGLDRNLGGKPNEEQESGLRPLPDLIHPNPGGGRLPPDLLPGADRPPGAPGLPLDPRFEAGRRLLEDTLAGQLAGLGPARAAVGAQGDLGFARLGTDEPIALGQLRDQLVGRGLFNSGIRGTDEGRLATDFLRSRQDLTNALAGQFADLSAQEAGFQGDYQRGLIELLLQSGANAATDPYAAVDRVPEGGGGAGGRDRRRRRRRRR